MWSKPARGLPGDWWLWGLVSLCLPLAGMSLAILCHPSKTSLRGFAVSSTAVPAWHQGSIPQSRNLQSINKDSVR